MKFELGKKVADFLQNNEYRKFTAREIAEAIFRKFPEACKEKQRRSKATVLPLNTDNEVIQQLIREIGSQRLCLQKQKPWIRTTEERPRKYYYAHPRDRAERAAAAKNASTSVSKS